MDSTVQPNRLFQMPIDDRTLQKIYDSDQEMYPAPLQFSRLKSWVTASPELSISFGRQERVANGPPPFGVIIALPVLRHVWEDLITGAIQEIDIDPTTMFPQIPTGQTEVGLHIFHIERFSTPDDPSTSKIRFSSLATDEVLARARHKWSIVGMSGTMMV